MQKKWHKLQRWCPPSFQTQELITGRLELRGGSWCIFIVKPLFSKILYYTIQSAGFADWETPHWIRDMIILIVSKQLRNQKRNPVGRCCIAGFCVNSNGAHASYCPQWPARCSVCLCVCVCVCRLSLRQETDLQLSVTKKRATLVGLGVRM